MILVAAVSILAGAIAYAGFHLPLPIAIIAAIATPSVLGWAWLRLSGRDAPTSSLDPRDPRSTRFLAMLAAAYRQVGQPYLADGAEAAASAYAAGNRSEGNQRFVHLSNVVARHARATPLISIWQEAWRESGR